MAIIDTLLNLVPDHPDTVLNHLQAQPEKASDQDAHGYSLLHAATSYGHLNLLRTLIQTYGVNPNILDEDGETCLFNAETVEFAKELLELGVKIDVRNSDGLTAAEKLNDEDEQPAVAAYLREAVNGSSNVQSSTTNGESHATIPPPPLPQGVQVNIGTMQPGEEGDEPDPEFRRRIEELAARQDFDSEQTQQELRNLVSDAVSGISGDGRSPATRRRVE